MGFEQIKVELIDFMGSDLSTVNSARVSFAKESDYLYAGQDLNGNDTFVLDNKDAKLIAYLADHRHMTPFRHNAIQIRCTAPIFIARQLGKHQAGLTWNEVSRRYVDTPPEFFTPDEWRGRPDGSIKQGSSGAVDMLKEPFSFLDPVVRLDDDEDSLIDYTVGESRNIKVLYDDLVYQSLGLYEAMIEAGVAPEMARMVLPQSMMTEWVWTGNLLAFAHVYKERTSQGAQLEARVFAEKLDAVIRPLFPVSWAALVDVKEDA
jgi:thymidylate synthase (FAD)